MEVKESQLCPRTSEDSVGGLGSIASLGDGVSKACLDMSAKQ